MILKSNQDFKDPRPQANSCENSDDPKSASNSKDRESDVHCQKQVVCNQTKFILSLCFMSTIENEVLWHFLQS